MLPQDGRTLVVLLTILTYADTLRFKFVYDDYPLIVANPRRTSWHYLPLYFTTDIWSHYFPSVAIHYYRPIFSIWLLINTTLFGNNPIGWHATNIALHLTVTVLVWTLAKRLTNDSTVAFLSAALFGIHPVHTEVVAWASSSSEMLMAIFVLASLLCLMEAQRTQQMLLWMNCSLVLYIAALLSKETAIMMPLAVFVVTWFVIAEGPQDKFVRALKFAAPFAVLSCLYWLVRSMILKGENYTLTSLSVLSMVLTWPDLLCNYLRLLIWPDGLSEFYDFTPVTPGDLRRILLPSLLILTVAFLLFWTWQKSRLKSIPIGSIWIVLWVGPAWYIRAFQPGEILHDRYLYLSSVGFCLLAGTAISIFMRSHYGNSTARQLLVPGALIVILIGLNVSQHRFWQDDIALYERGLRTAPKNRKVRLNLANALVGRGRYQDGIPIYLELLKDATRDWPLLYDIGFAHYQLNNLRDAQSYFRAAIALDPSNADEHKFFGLTQAKLGNTDLAEHHLQTAITLKPQSPGYHLALAEFYEQQGKIDQAIREFEAELSLTPGDVELQRRIADLKQRDRQH